MFFAALAADYDGTLATDGRVPGDVVEALKRFKETGRRLVLVSGRELADLQAAFPEHVLFDRVVAENGALVYDPATRQKRVLAEAPPAAFVAALTRQKVEPLSVGAVIVATWVPNETLVLETIKALGLELQIIFNKGAVMVLPPNINKATGLKAALEDFGLSAVNVVSVGDAENDHAFLRLCGCSAAVANALPKVKESADIVLQNARGAGVMELLERIDSEDADLLPPAQYGIAIGRKGEEDILLPTHAGNVLITGHSAVGKSTIATALTERMADKTLQFCILDPEGDFEQLENATQIGTVDTPPSLTTLTDLLEKPDGNLVINALAVPLADRPAFFTKLLGLIAQHRMELGRPHWLIVDEAHHVLPEPLDSAGQGLPQDLTSTIFITVHPDGISRVALEQVRFVVAAGPEGKELLGLFARQIAEQAPVAAVCSEEEVLLWDRQSNASPFCLTPFLPAQVHRRHIRKYAQGELGPDKSFYFRGPEKRLNLRAENLISFLKLADGVDDETWEFHRSRGDYSAWLKGAIKDKELATLAAGIEEDAALDPRASRASLRKEIEQRYTAPAPQST